MRWRSCCPRPACRSCLPPSPWPRRWGTTPSSTSSLQHVAWLNDHDNTGEGTEFLALAADDISLCDGADRTVYRLLFGEYKVSLGGGVLPLLCRQPHPARPTVLLAEGNLVTPRLLPNIHTFDKLSQLAQNWRTKPKQSQQSLRQLQCINWISQKFPVLLNALMKKAWGSWNDSLFPRKGLLNLSHL